MLNITNLDLSLNLKQSKGKQTLDTKVNQFS